MDFQEFCEDYDSIIIPKLQREYVQGSNEKGRKLIADIFDAITDTEDKDLPLDLIFGSFEAEGRLFKPVDGQQRLTTLFLLYLYIGKREIEEKKTISDMLNKFSYATRKSSRDFCAFLVNDIFMNTDLNNETPSELIKNHKKYYDKYNYDYTVQSMIKMLDIIHEEYEEKGKPCFDKLSRLKFEKCDLKEYRLNDELYVIMNDRGKSLSSIENFKSAFIGWMRNNKCKWIRDYFCENVPYDGQEIPRHLLFSMKMDNRWSESLWKLAGYDTAKADTAMYKIFCRYFWNMAVDSKKLDEKTKDYFYAEIENDFDFVFFQKVLDTTLNSDADVKAFFEDLLEYMDNLTDSKNYMSILGFIKGTLQGVSREKVSFERFFALDESYKDEKDSFSFGLNERFINFGLQLCLQAGKTINDSWKRFIWNITYAGYVNNAKETTISHINGIREFGRHTDNIYEFLSTCSVANGNTAAIKYEIRKAQYLRKGLKNSDCANYIFRSFANLEKHPFLQGDIDWFVLDDPEKDSVTSYLNRQANAEILFNNDGLNPDNRHLVVRYILSQRKIEFDSKPKKKEQTIYISEYDKDRQGLLNTQMHKDGWNEVIRKILECPNSEITAKMKDACNKMSLSYGTTNAEWGYWHKLICQKPELYENICDINSKYTPRLSITEKTLSIVMGGNSSNGRIILDRSFLKTVHYVLEELKTKGYEFKEYNSFVNDGIYITMFQYDHFSIRIVNKNSKTIENPYYLEIYSENSKPVFCISEDGKKLDLDLDGTKRRRYTVNNDKEADKWIEAVDKNIN